MSSTVTAEVVYMDNDAAANAIYWSDRARAAKAREAAIDAIYAMKGQDVVVVAGRKVALGTTGRCFWVGEGRYGWRLGFNTADGETIWIALSNVELAA